MSVWFCKIGPADRAELPPGSDGPMRDAVAKAFQKLTGHPPQAIFSGWGYEFTESEQAVIDMQEEKK